MVITFVYWNSYKFCWILRWIFWLKWFGGLKMVWPMNLWGQLLLIGILNKDTVGFHPSLAQLSQLYLKYISRSSNCVVHVLKVAIFNLHCMCHCFVIVFDILNCKEYLACATEAEVLRVYDESMVRDHKWFCGQRLWIFLTANFLWYLLLFLIKTVRFCSAPEKLLKLL